MATCATCRGLFTPRKSYSTGRMSEHCGRPCMYAAAPARRAKARFEERSCHCGAAFTPKTSNAESCSDECRRYAKYLREKRRRLDSEADA